MPRVAAIHRFPVKGLGGEHLDAVEVSRSGIPLDRALGITTCRLPIAPFGRWTTYEAFHALDSRPDLGGFRAEVVNSGGRATTVLVSSPSGSAVEAQLDDGVLAEHPELTATVRAWFAPVGGDARLVASGAHLWDVEAASLSIVNLATVRAVSTAAGVDLDPLRFRANVYLEGLPAWAELDLPGRRLALGDVEVEIFAPIERCRATSVDPRRGGADVNVPGVLAAHFGHLFCGIYGRVVVGGRLHVGDRVDVASASDRDIGRLDVGPEDVASTAPRPACVRRVTEPVPGVRSLEFADSFGLLEHARPGQHLRLHRHGPVPAWRNYTISRVSDDRARVTVRIEDDGRFSPWVSRLEPGDTVEVSGPLGTAALDPTDVGPVLVLTAGIGITPALAILHALAHAGSSRRIDVVHVARSEGATPHWDELLEAVDQLPSGRAHLFLTAQARSAPARSGRPSSSFIGELLDAPADTTVYLCGPSSFVRDMRAVAQGHGVGDDAIHSDPFYSPRPPDLVPRPAPTPGPFHVDFGEGRRSTWREGTGTLLDLAESAGLRPRASCRAGVCGTCLTAVRGEVFHVVDPLVDLAPGTALICSAVPVSDVEVGPIDSR